MLLTGISCVYEALKQVYVAMLLTGLQSTETSCMQGHRCWPVITDLKSNETVVMEPRSNLCQLPAEIAVCTACFIAFKAPVTMYWPVLMSLHVACFSASYITITSEQRSCITIFF